jgi:hypothetical protein
VIRGAPIRRHGGWSAAPTPTRFDFAIKIGESRSLAAGRALGTSRMREYFIINEILIIPALPCFVMGVMG